MIGRRWRMAGNMIESGRQRKKEVKNIEKGWKKE
jgi:type II secretory pathway component PulJ